MAAAGWQGGVLGGGLRFGSEGSDRQTQAGRAAVVGSGLATMAVQTKQLNLMAVQTQNSQLLFKQRGYILELG